MWPRLAVIENAFHGLQSSYRAARQSLLRASRSADGGVVFCGGHLFTGRNLGLDRLEIAVDSAQSLQRNHRTIIGQNTGHLNVPHVRQASDLVAA